MRTLDDTFRHVRFIVLQPPAASYTQLVLRYRVKLTMEPMPLAHYSSSCFACSLTFCQSTHSTFSPRSSAFMTN